MPSVRVFLVIGKYLLLSFVLFVAGSLVTTSIILDRLTSYSDDANWFDREHGLDASEYVKLGGVDQFIRIRSRDTSNPVMLDLHGGPGAAMSPMTHRSLRPLTEYFTLVEWDQRGTVRSPVSDELVSTMTYDRMVDDTVELIEILQKKLDTKKVILVGHSWGSMLGVGVIHKRPDLIHAYVGVGQAVAWNKNFDETRRLLIEAAELAGDEETLVALRDLSPDWPPREDVDGFFERVMAIQAPMVKYRTSLHASKSGSFYNSDLVLDVVTSPEITTRQALNMLDLSEATKELSRDLYDRDFRTQLGYKFDVPVILFQGAHDWQTPTTLAQDWFDRVNAPYKTYISFEDSAHMIINEEPGKYLYEMVNTVRPLAVEKN